MKKALVITILCALGAILQAQPSGMPRSHAVPPPTSYTINFESQHGESFSVFIDGDLQNRMPQSRVMVSNISDQTHEVVVILKRPVEKAAVIKIRPGERNINVKVNYDQRLGELYLFTPIHNRADADNDMVERLRAQNKLPKPVVIPPAPHHPAGHPVPNVRPVAEEELAGMVLRMKDQTFDSDRLALGKVIVASANLTALQIARLAETLDYSNSQVEFLKYSYAYCLDPENYYRTVDVLTFSSDKKKVMDYIASHK
ncbi:MAG: DUF4476 domain-containing protein [Bacteroidales bacterium]|nr:DUF4476 domain-containing protein [Bacteroidales bacterium]